MIIFSGDIGGTHTRVQFAEVTKTDEMKVIASAHYDNKNFTDFLSIIDAFFAKTKVKQTEITSVCFAVAGPVIDGKVNLTNLPWIISSDDIKNKLKLAQVCLINDFMSIGYGLEALKTKDLIMLQAGKIHIHGVKAFIGAGTGLGVGFVTCMQGECLVHATEGGHIDFAPTDAIQIDLLSYLRKKYHRVSLERVLSGNGLVNIYRFVCDNKFFGEKENQDLRSLLANEKNVDVAAVISEYAIIHHDAIAMRALDIFISIYGAAVGNLALTTLPFGGLYIVGGIAPKLLEQIKKENFYASFSDKGRMSDLLKSIPLYVVLNEDVGLHGAAIYAKKIAMK